MICVPITASLIGVVIAYACHLITKRDTSFDTYRAYEKAQARLAAMQSEKDGAQ